MAGMRSGAMVSRRRLLASAWGAGALTVLGGVARPYLSRAADRPHITHGVQSGDISLDGGIVWARADRPSRMMVEAATTESFKDIIRVASADALPESDFTAKVLLDRLPAGQDIFYRVRFHDIAVADDFGRAAGRPLPHGAAPKARRVVRLVRRHRGRMGHR